MSKLKLVWLFFVILFACDDTANDPAYLDTIQRWQQNRLEDLTAPNGWTTLVGLYWLSQGKNSIGSDKSKDIQFPDGTPDNLGFVHLKNDSASFYPDTSLNIRIGQKLIRTRYLLWPSKETNTVVWDSYEWFIIKRGDKLGIRLRDTLHPNRQKLKLIPSYPIDPNWKITAKVSFQDTSKTVMIQNVLGQNTPTKIAATLNFQLGSDTFSLYAIDGGPENYFVIFSDLTTGDGTYGGGRYLYPPKLKDGSKTILDFNKAQNPPCVFTAHATCPLPPPENQIDFAIEAGEKYLDFIH